MQLTTVQTLVQGTSGLLLLHAAYVGFNVYSGNASNVASLARTYLLSLATTFGMTFWVTFIAGVVRPPLSCVIAYELM